MTGLLRAVCRGNFLGQFRLVRPRLENAKGVYVAEQLRESHAAVLPGYHLNKRHWNTVIIDGSLPDPMIVDMIEDSYDLVVSNLAQAHQRALGWRSHA